MGGMTGIGGRRLGLLVAGISVAVSVAGGCTVTGTVVEQRVDKHEFKEGIGQAPVVRVETLNGRISVNSGGDGEVIATVTSRGSGTSQDAAQADLAKIDVDFDQEGVEVTITAHRTDRPAALGNSGAHVEVTVPRGSSLDLRTSNGRIEAANVSGTIRAFTSNGSITTRGGNGLDLDTTNAPISINNPIGPIEARTSNGPLDVIGATDALVTAQTTNATLTFSGSLEPGDHRFQTSDGDLTVSLPGDEVFRIEGSTSNGSVYTDFSPDDLTVNNTTISGRTGFFRVANVQAMTTNGDLRVMQIRP
jgi:hypothetical protein